MINWTAYKSEELEEDCLYLVAKYNGSEYEYSVGYSHNNNIYCRLRSPDMICKINRPEIPMPEIFHLIYATYDE